MSRHLLSRRDVLAGGAALAVASTGARAAVPPRVAALGWSAAQTLLALGVVPLAMPEIARYRSLVVEPPVPPQVQELGLRSEPNLELLKELAPDLVVGEPGAEMNEPLLARIAPTVLFATLVPGRHPTQVARASTEALAERLGIAAEAQAYLAGYDARMAAAKARLARYRGGPLCLVSDIFGNRALVFGANGLYQDVLDQMGLRNAFHGATSFYGHATVGLDVLAALDPETRLVVMTSRVPSVAALLAMRPLWRALPFLRAERVTLLPDILFFGGLPSAERFARLLSERLLLDDAARG